MDVFGRSRERKRQVWRHGYAQANGVGVGEAESSVAHTDPGYVDRKVTAALTAAKAYADAAAAQRHDMLVAKGEVIDAKKCRITNVAEATEDSDAITLTALKRRVPLLGRGVVDMKLSRLQNVLYPKTPQDAVNKAYLDARTVWDMKSKHIDARKQRIVNVGAPEADDDACTRGFVAEYVAREKEGGKATNDDIDDSSYPGTVQMHNRRLINIAAPRDSQDATTLAFVSQRVAEAVASLVPVTLLTLECLYPHPPSPELWYILPTGSRKAVLPFAGTLRLLTVSPPLNRLLIYLNVENYNKLPPQLDSFHQHKVQKVKEKDTLSFRVRQYPGEGTPHMDDLHLHIQFEYRMHISLQNPVNV